MRDLEVTSRPKSKTLRQRLTDAETILWSKLRRGQLEGLKFRRQHPVGHFIADFACHEARLIVEVDGATHATDDAVAYDSRRTAFLEDAGWDVIRIQNRDVYDHLPGVLQGIYARAWENVNSIKDALAHGTAHPLLPRPTGELSRDSVTEGVLNAATENTPSVSFADTSPAGRERKKERKP